MNNAQKEQEPIGYTTATGLTNRINGNAIIVDKLDGSRNIPLYTSPPKREWVGLSDEQINVFHKECYLYKPTIRAIEAKLKELNNAN